MTPSRPIQPPTDQLDAQAAAFAQLLGLAPNDLDGAYRQAVSLGDGLFPHQIEGVAFLLGRRRAILADDMGLGKTRQAIVSLRHAAPGGPYLVVCPASVKRNWAREIEQAIPGASVRVVEGSGAAPVADSAWTIVNYDILSKHVGALGRVPWAGLVFDEAHYLKNHTSARSKLARQLAAQAAGNATREPAVYLLTGTPLTNRPRDLFVLLQLVGHSLGRSFLSFAKRYCAAEKADYGWKTDGASNLEELTVQLHGVMLRRTKDHVLALPPKLRTWLPVDVPAGTGAREIRDVIGLLLGRSSPRAGGASVQDDSRARTHLLALLTQARQKLATAKAGATGDFVSGAIDQGEKVIVFSCFDEPLQSLAKDFGDAAVLLTGRTPTSKRQALVDRFQEDDTVRVFLANIIAGGIGLNLTAASQVVFNDLDWVPANHWQAEDRAYRIGQTRTVNVTYLIGTGTVDDFVQAVLETKGALVNAVVEGKALAADLSGSVLDELERALRAISPGLADTPATIADADVIERLLREASDALRAHESRPGESEEGAAARRPKDPEDIAALRRALEALARVLSGPAVNRYRIASTSQSGVAYLITADGADVTCSCPGFEYRGQCRHARDVKSALAAGSAVPAAYSSRSRRQLRIESREHAMIPVKSRHARVELLKRVWPSVRHALIVLSWPWDFGWNVTVAPKDTEPAAAASDPIVPEDTLALIAAHLEYLGYEVRLDPKGWSHAQHPNRYNFRLRRFPLGIRLSCAVDIGPAIGNSRLAWLKFLNAANDRGHIAQFSLLEDSTGRHVVRIGAFVSGAYSRPAFAVAMDMWQDDLDIVRRKPEARQESDAVKRAGVAVTVH